MRVCVCGCCRQLDRRGLIRLMCQTLEYCWHPNVAVCMLESLTSLVNDSEEYVAVSYYLMNLAVRVCVCLKKCCQV